ncbi:MAG: hypothetical protein V3W18_13850 [candidate division Zixibacteria bacterium]
MNRSKFNWSTILIFTVVLMLVLSLTAFAQDDADRFSDLVIPDENSTQILTLKDGSTIMGRITKIKEREIVFKSDIGEMTIEKSKIERVKLVSKSSIRKGKYWFDNPNTTRLYFAPTARMLKKGEGYFSDYYLFFPGIAYGFTDNFTFGGGMSLFPTVSPGDQLFYFTPKMGVKATEAADFAVGALLIALPENDSDESPLVGILYGVGTFGDTDGSLTVGLGYGFVDDELADKPLIMIGGEKRLSRRVSFVSENWIFPGADFPIVSYGFRFFGEGISVDLALFNALGDEMFFPGLPWIDFVFNFGD